MKKIILFALLCAFGNFSIAQVAGIWRMAEIPGAMSVYPADQSTIWWSNSEEELTSRACFFDDEYVFNTDGTFQNILGEQTWRESWQGVEFSCGSPIAPHDGSVDAYWSVSGNNLTIEGKGAFLGLPKVYNNGELTNPEDAPDQIVYPFQILEGVDADTMEIEIAIQDGNAFWKFIFTREVETTRVAKIEKDNAISLYPTLATNYLNIQSSSVVSNIKIFNALGRMVVSEIINHSSSHLNVSSLPKGFYLVKVELVNGSHSTERFIKK